MLDEVDGAIEFQLTAIRTITREVDETEINTILHKGGEPLLK